MRHIESPCLTQEKEEHAEHPSGHIRSNDYRLAGTRDRADLQILRGFWAIVKAVKKYLKQGIDICAHLIQPW
jgi:hypothetical protein